MTLIAIGVLIFVLGALLKPPQRWALVIGAGVGFLGYVLLG